MAKGDRITVHIRTGDTAQPIAVVASKRGRTVRQMKSGSWLVVDEMTAGSRGHAGRPAGHQLRVRQADVVAIEEVPVEVVLAIRTARAARA